MRLPAHEFDGLKYAQASTHQKEWGSVLIDELQLQGCESVLDLGCGDGALTARVADLLPQGSVVGIDASCGMIDAALTHSRPNLHFIVMDIGELRLSERFDVAFSNATLHWVHDHQALYERLGRLLHKGGRIRFNFAGDGNCSNFFAVVREVMQHESFCDYFGDFHWPWYMPSVEEYSQLVKSCGLAAVRVWGENADRYFPNVDAMTNWVKQPSLVPLLAHLPENLAGRFGNLVVERMIQETLHPDGRCFETFRRINVAAVI
jgi:trans-aconitate 2-methyltransferase